MTVPKYTTRCLALFGTNKLSKSIILDMIQFTIWSHSVTVYFQLKYNPSQLIVKYCSMQHYCSVQTNASTQYSNKLVSFINRNTIITMYFRTSS